MSEVKEVGIPIREFGVRHFVGWLRSSASSREMAESDAVRIINSLYNDSYCSVISQHRSIFRDFIDQKVKDFLNSPDSEVLSFHFKETRRKSKKFSTTTEVVEELIQIIRQEFGTMGLLPKRLTTAVSSRTLNCLNNLKRYLETHPNRSPTATAIKDACLLCRGLENLTNIYLELKIYITEKSISDLGKLLSMTWEEKINFLSEEKNKTEGILESLFHKDTIENFHKIRRIRNKIAHPRELTYEDLRDLAEKSDELTNLLFSKMPLVACITSLRISHIGTEVGIYSEADYSARQPTWILCKGFDLESTKYNIWDEVLVYPFVLDGRKRYRLERDRVVLFLRREEVKKKLYQVEGTEPVLVVAYQIPTKDDVISEETKIPDP